MATVGSALKFVKCNVQQLLPDQVILNAAVEVGHRWRQRKLGPVQTVVLLVLQILCGNASLAEARALGGYAFEVGALFKARGRLPLELLQRVQDWLVARIALQVIAIDPSASSVRVLLVDAANYYTPDTAELRRRWRRPPQQKSKRDYPQVRMLCVFDLVAGTLLAQLPFASDRHESPQLRRLLESNLLRSGDIVIFDRAFVSYANLCLLRERGVQVVARLARGLWTRRNSPRIRTARLGKNDAQVRWHKPTHRSGSCPLSHGQWRRLPMTLELRQVRSTVRSKHSRCRQIHLITSLLDPTRYPLQQIQAWYQRRWEIETNLRHLKKTLNLEFFKTKSWAHIQRELLVRAIAYNLVRLAMLHASHLRPRKLRISFADACRWLRLHPHIQTSLLHLLANPVRQRSARPRKVKYRGKNYSLLNYPTAPQIRIA